MLKILASYCEKVTHNGIESQEMGGCIEKTDAEPYVGQN